MSRKSMLLVAAITLSAAVTFGAPPNGPGSETNQGPLSRWSTNGLFGKRTPSDEVVSLRSERSKTFDNHNGTYTLVLSGRIHRRGEAGNWVEIPESELEKETGYSRQDTGAGTLDGTGSYDTVRIGTNPGLDPIIWSNGNRYFRVQFIYLSSELSFNGHIVALGFYGDGMSPTGDTIHRAQHWLKDVTYSTFGSNAWDDPGTSVWGESTLFARSDSNWIVLNLQQTYTHIHGKNLLVSYWHKGGTGGYPQWYRFTDVGADRGKRGRDNGDSIPPMVRVRIRPNIEIIYIPIYPDMQTTTILAPKDTVVSGQNYTPQATVRNNGPVPAVTLSVLMSISTGYSDSRTITNMAANTQTTVSFNTWNAGTLGDFTVKCSTRLNGDTFPDNNKAVAAGFVRRLDVQTTGLLNPPTSVDSGQNYSPQAKIRNNGNTTVSFNARYTIGGGYSNTQAVSGLAPGEERTVSFANWTALPRGWVTTRCTTMLSGDQSQSNDSLSRQVYVRVLDVRPVSITSPGPAADSGRPVTPQAVIANNGNTTVSLTVRFNISDGYFDSQTTGIDAGSQNTVSFRTWTPPRRGNFSTRCTTMLSGDLVPGNDNVTGTVTIAVHDVGVVSITAPSSRIPCGRVTPRALFSNHGTTREPVNVTFSINSNPQYFRTIMRPAGLPLGRDTVITFPEWQASPGHYVARCSTYMATDQVSVNDTLSLDVTVGTVDVAVVALLSPAGQVDTASVVTPTARIGNLGAQAATFQAWFRIDSMNLPIYSRSVTVTGLAADAETSLVFDTWPKPHAYGMYTTVCSTYVADDQRRSNDVLRDWFVVMNQANQYGWHTRAEMPAKPSGRPVSNGGWLAYDAGTDLIYGAKGNKTGDFYAYNPQTDNWQTLKPIPNGKEGKPPSKGAVGCASGSGVIYGVKGNGTRGFFRYSAATDTWAQLTDVPLGPSKKRVKAGSDLAYVPGNPDYVYLLKGVKNEFYRYAAGPDTWQALSSPPPGTAPKWGVGSWLAYDGTSTIYAQKGKYHDFYKFDVATDSWTRLTNAMPFLSRVTGKRKKSKDGGCGTWLDGAVYALKGGNTQEFWRYSPAGDSWHELDTMPQVGTSPKKARVKSGADIVPYSALLYALKGNKTTELWMYTSPPDSLPAAIAPNGVMASTEPGRAAPAALLVAPNPVKYGNAILHYTLPRPGPAAISIADVAGRIVQYRAIAARRTGTVNLDLSTLSAGVYLVRFRSEGFVAAQKLIAQR
jgi:N-acetylneuraminic acid mutarotase